ncbi:MAG: glycosyltransferase family 2 protein [Amphiplicatus sp.]
MTNRPPISAYVRTRNEARLIADVVRAALAVADEVVVIDSGSTDGTPQIAEKAGARVMRQTWLGNGHQKRVGEEACRHDWLLDLDADEVVTPALAGEISALFDNGEPACSVYRTPMAIAPPVGKPWIGFGGVVRHKLYDRRKHRAPEHNAWDQFEIPAGESVGRLTAHILHHAFGVAGQLADKVNRNSTTRAKELKAKPMPILVLRIFFAMPFYFLKRYILDGLIRGGVYGFAYARISAYGRWLRDVKMYERLRRERGK